jgi:GH43 family beta-xylosidase
MADPRKSSALRTYLNPVYPKSFPDPFVLKFNGEYFAYSTGFAADGNVFGVLRSDDLVQWNDVGGAMKPLEQSPPYYWAPEVTYDNGKFYLYYSVGNETFMELRVAVSDRPDSGFVDSGNRLTAQPFAIDAHVFIDEDGSKYLFYATDFLDHSHIGTGTVVDRMLDWFTLEGKPRPVTRAKYDWQVYDPNRKEKGGVRWHTVEGPAVLRRKGLYYEMFSGGNWQNTSYGVSFAVSEQIGEPDEWSQFSDGTNVLPILRTVPDTVIGPGHNCVVRGPNNRELYCIYHRWIEGNRVMAIDRMDFAGKRIFVVGASSTPQPAPFEPQFRGFDATLSGLNKTGHWSIEGRSALSNSVGRSEFRLSVPSSFLFELTFACAGELGREGSIGIALEAGDRSVIIAFHPISNVMRIDVPEKGPGFNSMHKLPGEFDWRSPHLLRVESNYRRLTIELDGTAVPKVNTFLPAPVTSVQIHTENQSVLFPSCELTEGFEELFEHQDAIDDNGWIIDADAHYRIENGELIMEDMGEMRMRKNCSIENCEFTANFRVIENNSGASSFGISLESNSGELFRYAISCEDRVIQINGESVLTLPKQIALYDYHQLRIIRSDQQLICYFDSTVVGEFGNIPGSCHSSIFGSRVQLAVEMIRLTAI